MVKTISIPKMYVEKLKQEKVATGQGYSEIIRRALDLYFDRNKTKNGGNDK